MNWQPIKTAPKDGTRVLLRFYRDKDMHVQTGVWRPNGNENSPDPFWEYDPRWSKGERSRRFQPTHWLPLPGPEGYPESRATSTTELLAALKSLVDRDLTYFGNKVMGDQITYAEVQAAREAIKKAEGK